jgi:DnaJ-class molecular chaperone
MKDFYKVLGVKETASSDEIKAAYRKKAMDNHPDRGGTEDKIKEINEAYDTLKDTDKKAHYDHVRKHGGNFTQGHGPNFEDMFRSGPFGFSAGFGPGGFMDIEELLRRHGQHHGPVKNRDLNIQFNISLEEAFFGTEKELTLNFPSGNKTVKVKIPPGVDEGMQIRLQGYGHSEKQNIPPGDLYLHLLMNPHSSFRREGQNLRTTMTINAIDAMLGIEKVIKSIDGSDLKVKIPASVQYGNSLRVQGKGMTIMNTTARGDLYVDVHIETPTLNEEQRKILEKIKI